MPTWNPEQYLRFADERTRPCRDLAQQIAVPNPKTIVDLGSGPGNSTAVLKERFPTAQITGVDSAEEMIQAAALRLPEITWQVHTIEDWSKQTTEHFDLVFSNAALQWVGDHTVVIPRLFARVAPGGCFAMQVPENINAPAHRLMRELASTKKWQVKFGPAKVREWFTQEASFYYDLLSPSASRIDFWLTEYMHVLPDVSAIVEWYKGSGLRPYMDALKDQGDRELFLQDFGLALKGEFKERADGKVLFPFKRLFLIAYA